MRKLTKHYLYKDIMRNIEKSMKPIFEEYVGPRKTQPVSRLKHNEIPYVHLHINNFKEGDDGQHVEVWQYYGFAEGIEFSNNKVDWWPLEEDDYDIEYISPDLYIRGKSPLGTNGIMIAFTEYTYGRPNVIIDGDIRTLVDWENYWKCDTSKASFKGLFKVDDSLPCIIDASELSLELNSDTCKNTCFKQMFYGQRNMRHEPDMTPLRKYAEYWEEKYDKGFYNSSYDGQPYQDIF